MTRNRKVTRRNKEEAAEDLRHQVVQYKGKFPVELSWTEREAIIRKGAKDLAASRKRRR